MHRLHRTLLIGLPLVWTHGIVGAAYALVLTEVLFAIGQWGCLFWLLRRGAGVRSA